MKNKLSKVSEAKGTTTLEKEAMLEINCCVVTDLAMSLIWELLAGARTRWWWWRRKRSEEEREARLCRSTVVSPFRLWFVSVCWL